jgi:hypothetical protein
MAPGQFVCSPAQSTTTTVEIKRLRFLCLLLCKQARSDPVKQQAWRAQSDTSRQRSTLTSLCSALCNGICHWTCYEATTWRYFLAFGPPNLTGFAILRLWPAAGAPCGTIELVGNTNLRSTRLAPRVRATRASEGKQIRCTKCSCLGFLAVLRYPVACAACDRRMPSMESRHVLLERSRFVRRSME